MIPVRAIAFGLAIGALGMTHLWVYRAGVTSERAAHLADKARMQSELFDLADRSSVQAAALDMLRRETEQAQKDYEDEARNDPGAALRVPDADSLRRLKALWGRAGAAP